MAARVLLAVAARRQVEPRQRGDGVGVEAGRVDHPRRLDGGGLPVAVAGRDAVAAGDRLHAADRLPPGGRQAVGLGVREQAPHQHVRVHDAGRRRPEGGAAPHVRFEQPGLSRRQRLQRAHAVRLRLPLDLAELRLFAGVGGDDQLAHPAVRHVVGRAPGVQAGVAARAQRGLQAARRVVDPGVHDLAVPAARLHAEPLVPLEQHHRPAARRQFPRARQADDAGPDDDDVSVHRAFPGCTFAPIYAV
jgi:hypothetical protein